MDEKLIINFTWPNDKNRAENTGSKHLPRVLVEKLARVLLRASIGGSEDGKIIAFWMYKRWEGVSIGSRWKHLPNLLVQFDI